MCNFENSYNYKINGSDDTNLPHQRRPGEATLKKKKRVLQPNTMQEGLSVSRPHSAYDYSIFLPSVCRLLCGLLAVVSGDQQLKQPDWQHQTPLS